VKSWAVNIVNIHSNVKNVTLFYLQERRNAKLNY